MAEILPGIHRVEGVDPSPDFSTHVWLLRDTASSWALVDTGLPDAHKAILAYLAKQKIAPESIKKIVITHLHRDHVGSLAAMAKATRARTFAHWIEAAYIAEDPKYDGPGMPPAEPFHVDERFKDGDSLDIAGGLIAYHTPGHTPGSTSYYLAHQKVLFSGDLFMGVPELALTHPDYTHHMPTAQISAKRMAALDIDAILNHHGGPWPRGAGAQLKALVKKF
ncbi:MAG TPA: MBL fold metallo-hydrolase [Thermoplasmata archaeon]|nr:MBL fold metallo-hydrolase [Thermoplasmata archaeon]